MVSTRNPPEPIAPASVRAVHLGPPMPASVLSALSAPRLLDLCRLFGSEVRDGTRSNDQLISKVGGHSLPALLREMGRDELRAVCRRHGLAPSARARADLQASIIVAARLDRSARARAGLQASILGAGLDPERRTTTATDFGVASAPGWAEVIGQTVQARAPR